MAFHSFMASTLIRIYRGATSSALFVLFGLGSLLLSPLMLLLGDPRRCQGVVRAVWRPLVGLFVHLGLISVDRGNLTACRGTILVANHPSFIDVVLLTVLLPRTISLSKPSVRRNPFLGAVARSVTVLMDEGWEVRLKAYLDEGWNILIFPEGTRSPAVGLHPFQRGAAQLALRTGAPLQCIGISLSRRILAKHQPMWDLGDKRVKYTFRADDPQTVPIAPDETFHHAALRVTRDLEARTKGLLV